MCVCVYIYIRSSWKENYTLSYHVQDDYGVIYALEGSVGGLQHP